MGKTYDVITVGSSTLDVFANTDIELITIKTKDNQSELIAYPCGSKILIRELDYFIGGGGTNTASTMSKLGLKVGWLGIVGDDQTGNQILDWAKKDRVDFLGKIIKGKSGFSVILDSIAEDRTILTYKGVNDQLTPDKVDTKKLKAKWFYFCSLTQDSYATLEFLAEFAKKNNIKIAFNPSNYLAEKGYGFLKKVLDVTNLLVLNKEEAELIVGKGTLEELTYRLVKKGINIVVVTDGKRGAGAYDGKMFYHVYPNPVEVKETTGAGDAFTSSFLAGLVMGRPIDWCLELASTNAEGEISKRGTKVGTYYLKEVEGLISSKPHKVDKKELSNIN